MVMPNGKGDWEPVFFFVSWERRGNRGKQLGLKQKRTKSDLPQACTP
jgi:hypothetical protein